jgi:tetratricopeptide (TPR) repeat protein
MTYLYVAAGIILAVFFMNLYLDRKKSHSAYYKLMKKLLEDQELCGFSGDWERKQEINLQILWLEAIREIEMRDIFGDKKEESESSVLSKLSDVDIKFPLCWNLDSLYHLPFAQNIVSGYGKILAENDYKGMYKPNNILPYPKKIIKKAIYFIFDYLNSEKPLYDIKDKKEYAENLNAIKTFLSISFIETGNNDLPKSGIENFEIGKVFFDKQPIENEVDDLMSIDWLDSKGWLLRGAREANINNWDFAIPCYIRSLELDPHYSQAHHCIGLAYHHKKQYTKSIEHYKKALINNQKNKDLLYNIGNSYLFDEKYDEAISYYLKVIDLDPRHGGANNNLAVAYSEIQRYDLERKYMKIAAYLEVAKAIDWISNNNKSQKEVKRILPTRNTPEIIFDQEGFIKIIGRSIPEDGRSIFDPIDKWITEYILNPADITYLDINLDIINGDSAKFILMLINKITFVRLKNKKFSINWYYKEGNEDILKSGEDFSDFLNVHFNLIKIK